MNVISILGSGWLGLPLAKSLVKSGCMVKASTTSTSRIPDLEATGAEPYIIDTASLTDDIKDFLKATTLIINIPSKSTKHFYGLANEIKASAVRNILFVSSTSVYRNVNMTLNESDTKYYSDSPLLDIERMLMSLEGKRTTIVRFGGLIGYERHPGKFISSKVPIKNAEAPVNLIHRDDCVEIIKRIVQRNIWGEILNCCADTHPSRREFYSRVVKSLNGRAPIFEEESKCSGNSISNYKLKKLLNYKFIHSDLMSIEFE